MPPAQGRGELVKAYGAVVVCVGLPEHPALQADVALPTQGILQDVDVAGFPPPQYESSTITESLL